MSGVHDDLAIIRKYVEDWKLVLNDDWKKRTDEYEAALDRVEAEIARLEREIADQEGRPYWLALTGRAEAAEARCAAMEECDCIPFSFSSKACPKCGRRGVVSDKTVSRFLIERNEFEARCARLQQALREIEALRYSPPSTLCGIARRALAALDTPADSQPEDGT